MPKKANKAKRGKVLRAPRRHGAAMRQPACRAAQRVPGTSVTLPPHPPFAAAPCIHRPPPLPPAPRPPTPTRPQDKYYQLAKEQGYRARSAFKLIQLNKKYDFLAKSTSLIDLCAAPGGWLQVAAKYMPSGSTIIGVDLMPIKPIRGVIGHREDITTPQCRALLKRDLAGKKCDVVLHDGAPNVGQNWQKDAFTQSELVLCSLKLATEFLKPRGLFITKVFRSADYNSLLWVFHQLFGKVEATKPHSSRNASAEIFVACREYRAPDKIDPRLLDPKYVFKEVVELTGTATGLAGGGGGNTVDVLHKKGHDRKVRQRDGYDEGLGPLLQRKLPVSSFIRSVDPVRVLTDSSALLFDADADALGYSAHAASSDEVKAACADLKVLGKNDFKALLKWRLALRRALPETLYRKARRGAAEGGSGSGSGSGSDDGGGDGSDGGGGGGSDSDDDSDGADNRALSAAAAAELRRRKREKKREAKSRTKSLTRQRLGMNLRSVDLLSTEQGLFDLTALRKLAARADSSGDGTGADVLEGLVADVDLDAAGGGRRAGVGSVHPRLDAGYDSSEEEEEEEEGADDIYMGSSGSEGEGDGPEGGRPSAVRRVRGGVARVEQQQQPEDDDDDDDDDDDEGGVLARMRAADSEARLDTMEEDMDAAYAVFLAKRERRAAQAAERFENGRASAGGGIKLTRRTRLEQQAVLTQASLEGKLDAEHQKYLRLLAGVKASGLGYAGDGGGGLEGAPSSAGAAGLTGKKRKREAARAERAAEDAEDDDDDDDDLSDSDYEEEADAAEGRDGGAAGVPSAKASRWYAQPIFSGALGSSSTAAPGASLLRLAAPSSAAGSAKAAARRAASAPAGGADAVDPFSDDDEDDVAEDDDGGDDDDDDGEEEEEDDGDEDEEAAPPARAAAAAAAAKPKQQQPAVRRRDRQPVGGGAPIDVMANPGAVAGYDSDGDINPLANIPKSERDKWKDKLRKRRDRADAAAARRAAKDEMVVVEGGGAMDAEDEFEAALARVAGAGAPAGGLKKKSRGVRFAGDEDEDDDDAGSINGDGGAEPADPRVAAKRDLIRRGMGASLAASGSGAAAAGDDEKSQKKKKGGKLGLASARTQFEVVAAGGGGEEPELGDGDGDGGPGDGGGDDGDESEDPRDADYDSDTHAELLALGKMLKRHTSTKQLVDASYNRYAFDDASALPAWFKHDEGRHFKPQLPIAKTDVEVRAPRRGGGRTLAECGQAALRSQVPPPS